MKETSETNRIDLWLKLCCVFRHRSEAADACRGGKVRLNGNRCKPASTVRPGDVVEIAGTHPRKLVVEGIPSGSISKQVARTMYRDESPPPPPRPAMDPLSVPLATRERGRGRPTKKERREIERYKG